MSTSRNFFKMHVCGNDFMVVDAVTAPFEYENAQVQNWSDRKKGIGFDQLLILESPSESNYDFDLSILNSDGSIAEQCGNGCAAVVAIARQLELVDKDRIALATPGGPVLCNVEPSHPNRIAVRLCVPTPYPGNAPCSHNKEDFWYTFDLPSPIGRKVKACVLSLGNPHAVVLVNDVTDTDLDQLGLALQNHERFPDSVNVEILQHVNRTNAKLRIFERGVGETSACGSGACAAVAAGRLARLFDSKVVVEMPGGCVEVEWSGANKPITLHCQPELVYEGRLADQ